MIEKIAKQIKAKIGQYNPEIAIILGSGLGDVAKGIEDAIVIDYKEIEGFTQSTVEGHKGCLIIGKFCGREVLCMQGRIHLYEGNNPQKINLITKVFAELGIKNLIVTNAAGSLDENMPAGSLMLIRDHINFMGANPLLGPNDNKYGPRFLDLSNAYDKDIRTRVKELAKKENINLFEGVYFAVLGPNFETAAEVKAFRALGGDAVGMSTVPEVICAVHSGMKVLGFSVITNLGTGMQSNPQSHDETLEQAGKATENLVTLIKAYLNNG